MRLWATYPSKYHPLIKISRKTNLGVTRSWRGTSGLHFIFYYFILLRSQHLEVRKRGQDARNFTLEGANVKVYLSETDEIGMSEMDHIASFYVGHRKFEWDVCFIWVEVSVKIWEWFGSTQQGFLNQILESVRLWWILLLLYDQRSYNNNMSHLSCR